MGKKGLDEYVFDNGFKLIVKTDNRATVALFQIFYKVGSSYETNGLTGISHALEHMMFRGTTHYNAKQFLQKISESGGQHNAYTTHDYTAYYELMKAESLATSLALESDRMTNLLLRKEDFSKEIQVVMEERRMSIEDDPQHFARERFYATAYQSSPYRHPIIGWMNDLENMSVADLRGWYKKWYTPNNALGIIVGDVDSKKAYQLAKKHFDDVPPSPLPIIKPQKEIKPCGMRNLIVKVPTRLPGLLLGFNVPVLKTVENQWEIYALFALCEILAGQKSSRLHRKLIREQQIATEVGYHYSPFARMDTVLAFSATPVFGYPVEGLMESLFNEIEQVQKKLVTSSELNRVKMNLISGKIYDADSIAHQAHEIGSFESVGLSWKDIDKAYKNIEMINEKQLMEVAEKYLIPDALTIAKMEPMFLSETMKSKKG